MHMCFHLEAVLPAQSGFLCNLNHAAGLSCSRNKALSILAELLFFTCEVSNNLSDDVRDVFFYIMEWLSRKHLIHSCLIKFKNFINVQWMRE